MAPVSRCAIGAMKIGEAPRTAPRSGSRLVARSRRSGIGVGRLVSRRALARSDGASGLRWLDRAPGAPKFAGRDGRTTTTCDETPVMNGSPGRSGCFPARRRRRGLSRARLDGTKTRRVGARRVGFVRTRAVGPTFHRANTASERANGLREPGQTASRRRGCRRRPVTTSRTERLASTAPPPPPPPTRPPRPHRASTRGTRRQPPPAARPSRPGWAPCPWSCSSSPRSARG